MIIFFRKHLRTIGWLIVFFFVTTMFAGTLIYKGFGRVREARNQQVNAQQGQKTAFAYLGNIPVSIDKYREGIEMLMQKYAAERPNESVPPDLAEMMELNAFNQAMQYTALLVGAENAKIKLTREEVNASLANWYKQANVKNKGEFKALLKKRNYDYNAVLAGMKNDIKVQKFVQQLQGEINVTDKDVADRYTQLLGQHILIRTDVTPNMSEKELQVIDTAAKRRAEDVYAKIKGGLDFSKAAELYSEDTQSKVKGGHLGWFGYGQMVPQFEKVAYALRPNEISTPVKTLYGYHIIRVLERKEIERPANLNVDQEKQQIQSYKQQQALNIYIKNFISANPIEILDPQLNVIKLKLEGKNTEAIALYQSLISSKPESPIPNYLLGKLYLEMGQKAAAILEFQKADLKGEMNSSLDIAVVHVILANLYNSQKDTAKAAVQYDKAIQLGKNDKAILTQLAEDFAKNQDNARLAKVKAELNRIALAEKAKTATGNVSQTAAPSPQLVKK